MSDTVRQKAEAALTEVEQVTAVVLPEPIEANAIVPLSDADAPTSEEITKRMAELDMSDTNSIVTFGSSAQAELQEISQSMLQDVRNKDVGPAGDSLRDIVTTIRGFSVSELDVRRERSFWEKATILHMLFHQDAKKPLADRMSRHYCDMTQLIGHDAKTRALADIGLHDEVGRQKSVFFKAAWARYEDAKPGSLRLLPNEKLEAALRRDYAGMREMIMGDAPSFDDVTSAIAALEAEINKP